MIELNQEDLVEISGGLLYPYLDSTPESWGAAIPEGDPGNVKTDNPAGYGDGTLYA